MAISTNLQDYFLPDCLSKKTIDASGLNVQDCAVNAINYYAGRLTEIAAFVAFVYIIMAGYQMFTAFGDETKYALAKKTLLYAIIGFAIALAARLIIYFFVHLLAPGAGGDDLLKSATGK